MSLEITPAGKYHVLAKIELTGLTLYYADTNLSMSDGNFYEGRLSVGTLQRAFSSFTAPKQRESTLTVTLKDADETIKGLLDDYVWGNRNVSIYVGKGTDLDDYIIDFYGVVKFPAGVDYDRKEVRIKLRDARSKDKVTLPINKFWTTDYPNLETGAEGQPIPLAYGDYTSVESSVKVWCIDTANRIFKIADHPISSIDTVAKNGLVNTSWGSVDLTNATFRLNDSYTDGDDEVYVTFKGKVNGSGTFLENPADIIYDILTDYMDVAVANIDTTEFLSLSQEFSDYKCRRYITEETSTDTLIEEMAIECLFDAFLDEDQYTVKSRTPLLAMDNYIDETEIYPDSLSVENDPESLYANRIVCNYKYFPLGAKYVGKAQFDNEAAQTEVMQTISRTINFNWLYLNANIQATAYHLILLYSKEIAVVKITLLGEHILTKLADRKGLTFSVYKNRPLVVRELSKNYGSMTCTIYAYDEIKHVLPGYWTDDDAPVYKDASNEQRASMGFWSDDNGLIDPDDVNSIKSCWW